MGQEEKHQDHKHRPRGKMKLMEDNVSQGYDGQQHDPKDQPISVMRFH
jgi:hypothetical protein